MRSEVHLDYVLAKSFSKKFQAGDKKSKSLQVCRPGEIEITSDLFLVKFGNNIFKFVTFGSLSIMPLEIYKKTVQLKTFN